MSVEIELPARLDPDDEIEVRARIVLHPHKCPMPQTCRCPEIDKRAGHIAVMQYDTAIIWLTEEDIEAIAEGIQSLNKASE